MNNAILIIFGVVISLLLVFVIIIYRNEKHIKPQYTIGKNIVRIAIFGAISAILYIFVKFPVPFLPSFLEFHFDEVPAFIASFAYGPIVGIFVLLVKTIIKLPFSTTLFVGELSDLIYSLVFILPAAIIYKKNRNFKSAVLGMIVGGILQICVAVVVNIYIMIPFYSNVMGIPLEGILAMIQKANPNITDVKWSYGLLAVAPFNLIKDTIVIIVTLFIYKRTHKLIDQVS